MKVFEYDKTQISNMQKKSKIEALLFALIGFIICLILFLVHSRNNTIIILPIVCVIASTTSCVVLEIIIGKLGYLKQYAFVVEKASKNSVRKDFTYIGYKDAILTRDHLRFKKAQFNDDKNNLITFYVLSSYKIEMNEGQKVSIDYVDDILLEIEAIDE